jgi:hypothetical protein
MDVSTANGVGPRAGRREWIGLAVLALPSLLYSMDLTVLYLAVPSLTADLSQARTSEEAPVLQRGGERQKRTGPGLCRLPRIRFPRSS